MTSEQKAAYHYKWDRFQKRQERIFTTKFKKALHDQIIQYAYSGRITSEPIYKVLDELYSTVGPLWAHQTQLNVKQQQVKARMPMGFNERIIELMRNYYGIDLLQDAELITTYTSEVIAKVVAELSEAAQSGASINDIVRALSGNTELSTMRAMRIARTEVVTSANGAAIIQAKETGAPMNKFWLAINDKRTRHSHRNVDGQSQPLDTPFNVNGTQMMQPGVRDQPNGLKVPAKEVVNCRCTVAFEVIE